MGHELIVSYCQKTEQNSWINSPTSASENVQQNSANSISFSSSSLHFHFETEQALDILLSIAESGRNASRLDLASHQEIRKPNCNLQYAPPCQTASSIILLIGSLLTFAVTYSPLNVSRNLENLSKIMDVSLPLTINAWATRVAHVSNNLLRSTNMGLMNSSLSPSFHESYILRLHGISNIHLWLQWWQ